MKEIENKESLKQILKYKELENIALQSVDIREYEKTILDKKVKGCIFLGCEMTDNLAHYLSKENYIFPKLDVPYNTYPNKLYNKEILYNGFDIDNPGTYENTLDRKIYNHYLKNGKETIDIKEQLARRLHDHSITDALFDFVGEYNERKLVAIMGGHGLGRDNPIYSSIAFISKNLTEKGFLMISGGGPGAMEATHVGAWFAGKNDEEMDESIKYLANAPLYNDPHWLSTAFGILKKFPESKYKSLGIPTWLYGHEPPTPFATHIAKYFANSVREEGLLAIAKGGIIFTPGSAGTMQEIFQELAQNHYETYGYASPMIFYSKEYWTKDRPVYPLIETMKERGYLLHLDIGLYDQLEEIIEHLERFSQQKK